MFNGHPRYNPLADAKIKIALFRLKAFANDKRNVTHKISVLSFI